MWSFQDTRREVACRRSREVSAEAFARGGRILRRSFRYVSRACPPGRKPVPQRPARTARTARDSRQRSAISASSAGMERVAAVASRSPASAVSSISGVQTESCRIQAGCRRKKIGGLAPSPPGRADRPQRRAEPGVSGAPRARKPRPGWPPPACPPPAERRTGALRPSHCRRRKRPACHPWRGRRRRRRPRARLPESPVPAPGSRGSASPVRHARPRGRRRAVRKGPPWRRVRCAAFPFPASPG